MYTSTIKYGHRPRAVYSVELKHLTQDSPNTTAAKHFCRSTRIDPLIGEHTFKRGSARVKGE